MSKKSARRPLSYPLRLPDELQASSQALLAFSLPAMQSVVDKLWDQLPQIAQIKGKYIWKPLEAQLARPANVPSRLWRCVVEGAGRTLRAQADRLALFDRLRPLLDDTPLNDPTKLLSLAYALRVELSGDFEKLGYVVNLLEQMADFYAEHERLPLTYFELQPRPRLKTPWLTLAADDGADKGQMYTLRVEQNQLVLSFKYPQDEQWLWTPEVSFSLPEGLEPDTILAPTLRLKEVKGETPIVVLDFIIEDPAPQAQPTGDNILAFDWGVRRLLTFVILNRAGEQLTPPVFVDIGGLAGKQARLRRQIDQLKAKRSRLRKRDRAQVEAELSACWRKYRAVNEALAHFAANLLLIVALAWNCNLIAGEWLKSLKARKRKQHNHFRRVRTLNWRINTTIRQLIWTKLTYRTKRFALRTTQVWPRGTSHECPRCGGLGITCKSPEHHESSRFGHWFCCLNPACAFNGDRDYVASLDIGRRALIERYPSDTKSDEVCQPASYKGAGAALPLPSPDALPAILVKCASVFGGQICPGLLRRLGTTLTGFNQAIQVSPIWLLHSEPVELPSPG